MPHGEISTMPIVVDALGEGKKVFVPYIHKRNSTGKEGPGSIIDMLALRSKEDLDALNSDKWGIPSLATESISGRENCFGGQGLSEDQEVGKDGSSGLDLVVMPGLAFDYGIRRLGHGKGFYDHFLHRYRSFAHEYKSDEAKMPYLGKIHYRELASYGFLTLTIAHFSRPRPR